jgi:hypothetical protein
MPEISTRFITVFIAFRDGREKGIDIDCDALARSFKIRANSTRWQVRTSEEAVGVIEGKLFKWWEEPGNPGGTKLHWVCPRCGREDWGDWTPEVSNPCLWYSNCSCIGKWLIHWSGKAQPEKPHPASGYKIVVL